MADNTDYGVVLPILKDVLTIHLYDNLLIAVICATLQVNPNSPQRAQRSGTTYPDVLGRKWITMGDWHLLTIRARSYQAEEEQPTNYALMAFTSSESSSSLDSEIDIARQEQEKYDLAQALELQKELDKRERWEDISSHFKGMSYDDVRLIFERVWDQNHAFVPKNSEIEKEVMKRPTGHFINTFQLASQIDNIQNHCISLLLLDISRVGDAFIFIHSSKEGLLVKGGAHMFMSMQFRKSILHRDEKSITVCGLKRFKRYWEHDQEKGRAASLSKAHLPSLTVDPLLACYLASKLQVPLSVDNPFQPS
ncbi:hypothetical protein Tco_0436764 [Tanacetum coccineum]